jgi:transposase-like protein
MTTYEQEMLDMGCPECGNDIELYETNPNGNGGKYRCKHCGRDTVWATGKSISFMEMLLEMKKKMDSTSFPNRA